MKIDLGNPTVLKNFILTQAREGRGKFSKKTDVYVFTDDDGNQFVVPEDAVSEIKVKRETKKEPVAKKEEPKKEEPKKEEKPKKK